MNEMPLTFTIPLELPNIELIFWMRPFTVDTLKSKYRINYPYTALYLQKILSYNEFASKSPDDKSHQFVITKENLEDVKDTFKEVSSWFTEENKQILYGRTDDGILMFNSDYQKLAALCVNEYSQVRSAIKIVPTVIEVGYRVYEPGVVLYISSDQNGFLLREYQIKRLCKFIIDFNFIPYSQFAMQCFQYCLTTGSILSREQVQQRLNAQKQYNTNFRF